MHQKPFREHHLLQLLQGYEKQSRPLDFYVSGYFRAHKAIGAKDRKSIAEGVYGIIRWLRLIDALCSPHPSWEERAACYLQLDVERSLGREDLPLSVRYSCPEELFQLLVSAYGEEKARLLCLVANTQAPPTVRVNTLKISREKLLESWASIYQVAPCSQAPDGILFRERIPLFSLPEFSQGFFEMQDEASQLVADLMEVQPGDQVLDFCAGSGGKTLAFAPKMKQRGQIFLHDNRPWILDQARKRLRRAGIQNAQIILPDAPHLKKLKKRMDWVLVDAPCTGTGTFRRNPDMKWKFNLALLDRLIGEQRTIFEQALSYLKPGGKIVYATCSLLPQENEQQLDHFKRLYCCETTAPPFASLPVEGGMDGFFGAILTKNLKN